MDYSSIRFESGKAAIYIFPGLCKGCGLCIEKCPVNNLGWSKVLGVYGTPSVEPGHNEKGCRACTLCENICPDCAIYIEKVKLKN